MRRAQVAFTLLEAVVALALLSAVAVASLSVRAASVAAAVRIERRLAAASAADAALRMALAGALFDAAPPPPRGASEAELDAALLAIWRGDVSGLACECVREVVRVPAPRLPSARDARADASDSRDRPARKSIRALRFSARCGGEEAAMVLPAP